MDACKEVAIQWLFGVSVIFGALVCALLLAEYVRGVKEGAYLEGLIEGGRIAAPRSEMKE